MMIPARPIKNGTTILKTVAGRANSSNAPKIAPTIVIGKRIRRRRSWPFNSWRDERTALKPDVTSAKLLVTLAATGVMPIRSRAGYETNDANPAAELMVPAAIPASTNQQSVKIQCTINFHLFFKYHQVFGLHCTTGWGLFFYDEKTIIIGIEDVTYK